MKSLKTGSYCRINTKDCEIAIVQKRCLQTCHLNMETETMILMCWKSILKDEKLKLLNLFSNHTNGFNIIQKSKNLFVVCIRK